MTSVGRTKTIPMFQRDISKIMENRWGLVQKDTESTWAARNIGHDWPEYADGLVGVPDAGDDDSAGSQDEENEGDRDPSGEGDEEGDLIGHDEEQVGSVSDSEDDDERVIREAEEYMAEFVQPEEESVEEQGLDNPEEEDDRREAAEEADVASVGCRKKGKRRRL